MDFKKGKWAEAEKRFRENLRETAHAMRTEALYWAGVSHYKREQRQRRR